MAPVQIVQSPGARRCQRAILPRRRGNQQQNTFFVNRKYNFKKQNTRIFFFFFFFVVVWDILDNNQTLFLFKIVVKQDQEYLKPSVVHALANAELYCLALAHIYADPN